MNLIILIFCLTSIRANIINNDNSSSTYLKNHADQLAPSLQETVRSIPVLSPLSRIITNLVGSPSAQAGLHSAPRIQYETYKALAGETVRLECPQPNPTWFFRRANSDGSLNSGTEDLIVTRHGIINADYKYKIMCHMTLKHKVIIINNIDFDEEGLYTCLYTQPLEVVPKSNIQTLSSSSYYSNNNNEINEPSVNQGFDSNPNPIQYRYVFNVTVYTLISGLSMSLKPISMKSFTTPAPSVFGNKKHDPNQPYDLVESSLTVRENEEFYINCVVDSSKPSANITFNIAQNVGSNLASYEINNQISSSIVSTNMNVFKNNDRTFKTVHTSHLKASQEDHGKVITCKAENGFSNQKWENRKLLNVLFAPVCKDPPSFTYYIGINQTLNVECRILNANPSRVTYEWDLDNIDKNAMYSSNMNHMYSNNNKNNMNLNIDKNKDVSSENILSNSDILVSAMAEPLTGDHIHDSKSDLSYSASYHNNNNHNLINKEENNVKLTNMVSEGLTSRFKWRPNNINDFGIVKCKATNEIGSTECIYEIKLGGIPNPPTECTHILKNTSAIISCQVGFHQGDPDIYCYLLRKSDNGVYKEHTRNRESCSFIVNDVNVNKLNEFWIYSSNKHGHNKDNGVYLTIGQNIKPPQPISNKNYILVGVLIGVFILLFMICCFCLKVRKGLSDDSDSVFEGDAYQPRNLHSNSNNAINNINKKQLAKNYPVKIIKGVKVANQDSSYDINDHINDQKYIKVDGTLSKKPLDGLNSNSSSNEYYEKQKEAYATDEYFEDIKLNNGNTIQSDELYVSSSKIANSNSKKKKFYLFKTSSLTTSSKIEKIERLDNQIDINENVLGVGSLVRNSINNTKIKNSLSFTKPLVNDDSDDHKSIKESTPFFNNNGSSKSDNKQNHKNAVGLLTTVDKTTNKSSLSYNSLNDPNALHFNGNSSSKMVTFGNSTMRRNSKLNQSSTTTLTNTNSTITTNTSASSSSSSSESASASTSTTSPTTSSTNNDIEYANDSVDNNILTVSDHSFSGVMNSFNLPQRPNKLLTFSNDNIISQAKSPRKVLNNKGAQSKEISRQAEANYYNKINDSLETKFLNKLCEEIEVSLNVDCECADDYSSNDFSGDYSFDNDIKSISINGISKSNSKYSTKNQQPNKIDPKSKSNLEQSVKQLSTSTNNSSSINNNSNFSNNCQKNGPDHRNSITNGSALDRKNSNSPSNRSHQLGVLV